jgi:hypothetical protein
MVTGNYQIHLTTLLFLPDPALLLPIRGFSSFPKAFLENNDSVALDPGIVTLKPSCVYLHHHPLPAYEYTPPPLIPIILHSYRFSYPASNEKGYHTTFCVCMCINGSVQR